MKVDLHTHTVASGHAFGTVWENAKAAKEAGVELLAITDHGPGMSGATVEVYFQCGNRMPRVIEGVTILFGVEANVINDNGDIDLSEKILKRLDFVTVGLHEDCGYVDQGVEKNTEALIKAMNNPYVKMISHPYAPTIKIDIEKVTQAAIEKNILLEINASYFREKKASNVEMWAKLKTMVGMFKAAGKKMIINSDAHSPFEIGQFGEVVARFDELGISEDDLLNNDVQAVLKILDVTI